MATLIVLALGPDDEASWAEVIGQAVGLVVGIGPLVIPIGIRVLSRLAGLSPSTRTVQRQSRVHRMRIPHSARGDLWLMDF